MIASPYILTAAIIAWAFLTWRLWSTRRWLVYYLTGALGFVILGVSLMRVLGLDSGVELIQARQVIALAGLVGIELTHLGASGLAIPNHTGWAIFDIGIECSAILETLAFAGLVGFYPAFRAGRKAWMILAGIAATWAVNLLRILLIVGIINEFGTSWVYPAHAVFGRIFFFLATVGIYWYLITRPTIAHVSANLGEA